MKLLEEMILNQGVILEGNVLKVDNFLNHQIDPGLMEKIGNEFYEYFKDKSVTKVLTVESSGIAPALMTAAKLQVPLVFIKKSKPSTMNDPLFCEVYSYTKQTTVTLCMERRFLNQEDRILFIDDFLANGQAFMGVEKMIKETKAQIVGVGMVIDKAFQKGHAYIVDQGYDLLSLAKISSFEDGVIEFD